MLFRVINSQRFTFLTSIRRASILTGLASNPVIVSANRDVYTNLALEQWLYSNVKFSQNDDRKGPTFKNPVVLLWIDDPSLVIGRHQNPWIESTLGFLTSSGIKLARRHSGGGCVYHDENNVNISIISPRNHFERRQENLKFLASVLDKAYGVKCEVTKRHDLIHVDSGAKISGSAARLGRQNCFHHFTLLVNTHKDTLHSAIRPQQQEFITTNSSCSVRSNVINLKEINSSIELDQVVNDLASAYSKLYGDSGKSEKLEKGEGNADELEELKKIKANLMSWEWIYGMTPKFRLEKVINMTSQGQQRPVKIYIEVNKGLFDVIKIEGTSDDNNLNEKFLCLVGTKFTYRESMVNVAQFLKVDENGIANSIGLDKLFSAYLLQMIHDCNYLTYDGQI